jgi:hypothetical protein
MSATNDPGISIDEEKKKATLKNKNCYNRYIDFHQWGKNHQRQRLLQSPKVAGPQATAGIFSYHGRQPGSRYSPASCGGENLWRWIPTVAVTQVWPC